MKPIHLILLIVIAAGVKQACDVFTTTHKALDAVVSGVGASAVTLIAGLTPAPSQGKASVEPQPIATSAPETDTRSEPANANG